MKNKKRNKYMLLLILLLAVSIGYAALATTLKINGSATITKNNWDVYWANPVVTTGSVTQAAPTLSAESGKTANTIATWTTTLNLPGDFYEFTIDAVNNGTIDAMITDIEDTVTPTLPSYIKYEVTYDDGVAIANNHLLAKKDGNTPTTEKYKVRVEFLDTITPEQMNAIPTGGLSYEFTYEVTYGQATDDAIPKPTASAWVLPSGRTKDNLQVGDEICLSTDSTQCFNFIRYDNNDIVMLAKYNLKVGTITSDDPNEDGEYTSSDPGYNKQSSEARGFVEDETSYGTVAFCEYHYWYDNGLKPEFGSSYPADVYDAINYKGAPGESNYSIAYYVDAYKDILETAGATIKSARLLTYSEATDASIGCNQSSWSCPTNGFITNTSFWLGSAVDNYFVADIDTTGVFDNPDYDYGGRSGVRPVIVVAKSDL